VFEIFFTPNPDLKTLINQRFCRISAAFIYGCLEQNLIFFPKALDSGDGKITTGQYQGLFDNLRVTF